MFELTSDIPDSGFHFDFDDWNICLKSNLINKITVQLQAHIALHCVTSLHKSNKQFEPHQHWRRNRWVKRTTQVQWESTHAYSPKVSLNSKPKSQTFLRAELLPHNRSHRPLFSYTLIQLQLCRKQGISVISCSGVWVDIRYSRLWLSLWLWWLKHLSEV